MMEPYWIEFLFRLSKVKHTNQYETWFYNFVYWCHWNQVLLIFYGLNINIKRDYNYDINQKDTQHNDIQQKDLFGTLSINGIHH